MQSLDFLRKDLVETFYFTNVNDNRTYVNREIVNGREVDVRGQVCATTLIGLLYRVYDPSVESYKYILHVGVANQGNADAVVDVDEEYEEAYINALMNPQIQYVIGDDYTSFDWKVFSLAILSTQPKRFVLTDEEVRIAQFFDRYGKKYPKDYLYFNLYKSRGLKETL
jgi:hypothetical protein